MRKSPTTLHCKTKLDQLEHNQLIKHPAFALSIDLQNCSLPALHAWLLFNTYTQAACAH